MAVSSALYIGILSTGTTSRMRCDTLRRITPSWEWTAVDTDVPFHQVSRVWRSIGFRWQHGPLVWAVNDLVRSKVNGREYDVIWIDKAIYLNRDTIHQLRSQCDILIHFTPDTAFHANRSKHFYRTIDQYDLLVTTKSFEISDYEKRVDRRKIHLTTQAYDDSLHNTGEGCITEKGRHAVFIGLCEPDRQRCIAHLLDAGVAVQLGGRGWDGFVAQYRDCPHLSFLGDRVFGDAYVSAIRNASVGLGLLSKKFPELHTTRTLEIPACGTALATERNAETSAIYSEDEAIFFDDYAQLADRVGSLLADSSKIDTIGRAGHSRVVYGEYSYEKVLSGVLRTAGLTGSN